MATAHVDTFARDNLPPPELMPEFINLDMLGYPDQMNCAEELLDTRVEAGHGDDACLRGMGPDGPYTWTYAEVLAKANQVAHLLVDELGVQPGNRVLIRGGNSPWMAVCWLAVQKVGAVGVPTMSLLRATELDQIAKKAEVQFALCDVRLRDEWDKTAHNGPTVYFNGDMTGAEVPADDLSQQIEGRPTTFDNVATQADDIAIIAFTSGTTGTPKGALHFHRDVLAMADTYGVQVAKHTRDEIFVGSPPLAFTFGLGGMLAFPMRAGASVVLIEQPSPAGILEAVVAHKATTIYTAPTMYRVLTEHCDTYDLSTLRKGVSAGETLSEPLWHRVHDTMGIRVMDGIGSTEMTHIFVGSDEDTLRPGFTGKAVPGYVARVVDDDGNEVPPGTVGVLSVKGPTGCKYLADDRQRNYVKDGWNYPNDTFVMDEDGYFKFQARADDMIVSSGYNIGGPEVETALMKHPDVEESAVVGAPDPERGSIVQAWVVLRPGVAGDDAKVKELQTFVKDTIAPFKYPRSVKFLEALPKTQTGKIQRFKLRKQTGASDSSGATTDPAKGPVTDPTEGPTQSQPVQPPR